MILGEKHWHALRHRDMEDYAAKRLGLQRSALYHYLQLHDWLREFHPSWLAPKPKGFIPELSDASALMWMDRRLREARLSATERKELEALRRKALAGAMSETEFRAFRARVGRTVTPMRAALRRLRSLRRSVASIARFPSLALASLDVAIREIEQALGTSDRVVRLAARRARRDIAVA